MTADSPGGSAPVVLVTGATGGIGAATAQAYARRGARLVLVARSAGRLAELRTECEAIGEAAGCRAVAAVADVADGEAVERAFEVGMREFGRVDVVVHAAAVLAYGRFEEVPAEVWDRVVAVDVTGTTNVARSALRRLRAQGGGSLVVIGSVVSHVAVPLMGSYVASKWAQRGLVRVLQLEARDTPGLHVGMVHPGAVGTAIYALAGNYTGRVGRPPPPVYPPERVAEAILEVVDRRLSSRSVGVGNPVLRLGFTVTPWLYAVLVGPLMRLAGLSRRPVAPHPGNVFTPSEDVVAQ